LYRLSTSACATQVSENSAGAKSARNLIIAASFLLIGDKATPANSQVEFVQPEGQSPSFASRSSGGEVCRVSNGFADLASLRSPSQYCFARAFADRPSDASDGGEHRV
jgi:hypothetical protein